jgi:hypothetical protein
MADPKSAKLELSVEGESGADADQIDREARQLRVELRELDLGSVEMGTAETPSGAKAGEGFALGSLLMEVLPNAISPLIDFLRSWALRRKGRIVKVKIVSGDKSIETEFDPATVSTLEIKSLVSSMTKNLEHAEG